ncbi:MAG: hypothetical protein WBC55_05405 [Dehalococcoidia bacterium]
MGRIADQFERAKQIYQTGGFGPLMRQAAVFAAGLLFLYQTYYVCANITENVARLSEAAFTPRIDDFTLEIVSSNQQAEELEARGFEFRSFVSNAIERLDKGAIAFCVFAGGELANLAWLATTQQAQDSLNQPPIGVDYSSNEAYTGGAWTHPKYRQAGLHSYNTFIRMEFSLRNGIVRNRYVVAKRNLAPQAADAKFGNVRYREARLLKVLWWKSWKERPLPPEKTIQ